MMTDTEYDALCRRIVDEHGPGTAGGAVLGRALLAAARDGDVFAGALLVECAAGRLARHLEVASS